MTTNAERLIQLLRLASPLLPVGAYSYSQGLEAAAAGGEVFDEASAGRWISEVLRFCLARAELPLLHHMLAAPTDRPRLSELDAMFLSSRESSELRAETLGMGTALRRMQLSLDQSESKPEVMSYPAAFALSAAACGLAPEQALLGYAYAWLENQVAAAMKIVPLGQVAGQRLLLAIGAELPAHLARAAATSLEQIQTGAPAFAITCSTHETQYSRIFRS